MGPSQPLENGTGDSMTPDTAIDQHLREFLQKSNFLTKGAVITDLDGTAVHEKQGRIYIPEPVEFGLKQLHSAGRRFILNSLRFPLSVMRTFGKEWYAISNAPIPLVSLNGSLIGRVDKNSEGELVFEEIEAFPLTVTEIEEVLKGVGGLIENGIKRYSRLLLSTRLAHGRDHLDAHP
jgi:hypothetical protein